MSELDNLQDRIHSLEEEHLEMRNKLQHLMERFENFLNSKLTS